MKHYTDWPYNAKEVPLNLLVGWNSGETDYWIILPDEEDHEASQVLMELSGIRNISLCVGTNPVKWFNIKSMDYPNSEGRVL